MDKFPVIFSECGQYQYRIDHTWDENLPKIAFIMLNPSPISKNEGNKTFKKCISYAKSWNYGGIIIGNLFAFRTEIPNKLYELDNPIGLDNDKHLIQIANDADDIIFAWGNHGKLKNRDLEVIEILKDYKISILKLNLDGSPSHPLYLPININKENFNDKIN